MRINPCGYQGLAVTQLRDFATGDSVAGVGPELADILETRLGEGIT